MTTLDLTEREQEVLSATIESYLADLRMEIAETDSLDYREMLKEQKQILTDIQERLQPGEVPVRPHQ